MIAGKGNQCAAGAAEECEVDEKRIDDLERKIRFQAMSQTQLDDALAEIMRRSGRSSTLDVASARRTLEEIHLIARKARGFE